MKTGDRVYVVPSDSRIQPYYTTIKSIGRKYITTDDHRDYSRFDINTKLSVESSTGWNPRLALYASKEEYEKKFEERQEKLKCVMIISKSLSSLDINTLHKIIELIANAKNSRQ